MLPDVRPFFESANAGFPRLRVGRVRISHFCFLKCDLEILLHASLPPVVGLSNDIRFNSGSGFSPTSGFSKFSEDRIGSTLSFIHDVSLTIDRYRSRKWEF